MDDSNEENIEANWVILNPVDIAEEAVETTASAFNIDQKIFEVPTSKTLTLDHEEFLSDSSENSVESDIDTDGISIISESSHTHDHVAEEKHVIENVRKTEEITENSHSEDTEAIQEPRIEELAAQVLDQVPKSNTSCINKIEQEGRLVKEVRADTYLASKLPAFKKYLNGFIIGSILLATSSVFLGWYFNATDELEKIPQYPDKYDVADNVHDDSYDVPTALAYCTEKHKNDLYNSLNIQKCLRKIENRMKRKEENKLMKEEMGNLQKRLKIKENFLIEKEKYLARKEYELNTKENEMRKKTKEAELGTMNTEDSESDINSNNNFKEPEQDSEMTFFKKYKDKRTYQDNKYNTNKRHKNGRSGWDFEKDGKDDYDNEQNVASYYNKNKDIYYSKDKLKYDLFLKELKKQKLMYAESDNNNNANRDNDDDYDVYHYKNKQFTKGSAKFKKHKSDGKNTDYKKIKDFLPRGKVGKLNGGYIKKEKSENHKKQKDKECPFCSDFNESDVKKISYKYYKSCKEDKKAKKYDSPSYLLVNNKNESNTMSGYWVGKLFKGRNDLRNREHSGEWYFDRASYRKNKRDKAKWYFDWMMDREIMRYKRSFGADI